MNPRRFSIAFGLVFAAAATAMAADVPVSEDGIVLAQGRFKETPLDDMPAVDSGRGQPPAARTRPPAADDDQSGPPARETPPPPRASTPSAAPPTRLHEPAATRRAAPPAYDDPPLRRAAPPRRADAPRRAPPARSAFYANCTQQCHLSCEASFEACNGDASPAKPACVKKLESCRVERCSCRIQ